MMRLFKSSSLRLLTQQVFRSAVFGITLLILPATSSAEESAAPSVSSVLERANALYAEKKYDEARKEFERAVELDEGSLPAWRGLAWSHWALGQKERAIEVWTDLLKAFPEDAQTLLALSEAYEEVHRWNEAINSYTQLVNLDPHNAKALKGRARTYIAQHQFQLAEQDLKAAFKEAPSDRNIQSLLADALMGQGRYQEAEGLLKTLAQAEPAPKNTLRLAKALAELGRYEQAAELYKTSYSKEHNEGIVSAWRGLGSSLRKAGQNQRAYNIWRGLLQDVPNDLATHLAICRANEQDQLWQEGLNCYAQVLQRSPGEQVALLGRAKIFIAKKDYRAAERELKSILARSPSDIDARAAMVEVLLATNRGAEAERMLEPLVALDPVPKKLNRLGTVLADLGRDEEAAKYFQKSLQIEPDNVAAVLGMARSYWFQQRYDESIKLLQSYLAKHPDDDLVRARLVEHASAATNWALAERELKILQRKYPDDIKWSLKLAHLLHRAGRHEEAVALATDILKKNPNEISALGLLADDAVFSGNIEGAIFWTERLAAVEPTLDRLVRVGRLRLQYGEMLDKENKHDAAVVHYKAATVAFERAMAIDPIKLQTPVDLTQSLRLEGRQEEALQLGRELYEKYPNSADVIKQLAVSYREQGDYAAARDMLANNMKFFPNSSSLQQNLAELTYYASNKGRAFKMLNEILKSPHRPTIPVLLYHGITVSDRQDTVPLKNFREQMLALKEAGYESITPAQLRDFYANKGSLPAKPVLITFDDARADSFKYADPVLAEMGFRATMFVPVKDVAMHQPYAAVWKIVREMYKNGRWDLQCHGSNAQHWVPVDAEGHIGHFLANRMWFADKGRLETEQEYSARVKQDMQTCIDTLKHEVPGVNIFAFAFPYGDQGHRSLSNAPYAFDTNQHNVKKLFNLAFNVDNTYLVTKELPKYSLPRFEVPRTYSGKDLVQELKTIDPELSTYYKLAHLDVEYGRYGEALEIYDKLAKEDAFDQAEIYTNTGKVLSWTGDHAGARTRFDKAIALKPGDPDIQKEIDKLNRRLGPSVQMQGLYFKDNANRTYYSFSPSALYGVSDRLTLGAYYKYLDFSQRLGIGDLRRGSSQQDYDATGNQFGAQMNYELAARSLLSMSAGFVDFSTSGYPAATKSGRTFPLGAIKFTTGIGDRVDLSLAGDYTHVNTAGAIANGIAFGRGEAELKAKLLDTLTLRADNSYFYYTDENQRNRTEVELDHMLWNNPDISIGAQFIYDDAKKITQLFWTPSSYMAFTAPIHLKKKWGDEVIAELTVDPGMGKEAGSDFGFQFNSAGSVNWNVRDDLSLNLTLSRYQAASYSNFSAFGGMSLRF